MSSLYQPNFEKDSCGFGLIVQREDKSSHWLVETAISALCRLSHRGAVGADGKTSDGCGLLLKKPDDFFRALASEQGYKLAQKYAVGMVFLSFNEEQKAYAKQCLEAELSALDLVVHGWREVMTDDSCCGDIALANRPSIAQIFVSASDDIEVDDFERRLYVARRLTEKKVMVNDHDFYILSLSSKVIVYKALVMAKDLATFYPELNDKRLSSSLVIFHQRFSTNTLPNWRLAHPFRYLAHNGEINTIRGNRYWIEARSPKFKSGLLDNIEQVMPLVSHDESDSCSLDGMVEFLLNGGMDIFNTMRLLMPPAWNNISDLDPNLRSYYEYVGMNMEPWDGPAGIVLTDGRYGACVLDRNGLRPARYIEVKDGHIILGSEVGLYDYPDDEVISKGRLKPGQMIAVDTASGELLLSHDIDEKIKYKYPCREWLKKNAIKIESNYTDSSSPYAESIDEYTLMDEHMLLVYQKLYQVSYEECRDVIQVLAEAGQEAIGSMGDDTPLPVLSTKVRSIYDNFRQQFAQVTNPPIDPLREKIVMSLNTHFGMESDLFNRDIDHATKRVIVSSPILSEYKYHCLLDEETSGLSHKMIDLNYPKTADLHTAIVQVCDEAVAVIKQGHTIIILSDRHIKQDKYPIPAAMATGAVHHRLIQEGLRCDASIIVETACARDSHHCAVLLGYGATAIYPYLAVAIIRSLVERQAIAIEDSNLAWQNYRAGINKGLCKIMSKMGIATVSSYRGAQLFEIVGIHQEVVDLCFRGTVSRIQGMDFKDFADDIKIISALAWNPRKPLNQGGLLKFIHDGENHAYNPDVVKLLHQAVESGDYDDYKQNFSMAVNQRQAIVLRDLLKLKTDVEPIDIDEVEPIANILKRFDSAGMSLGALSPVAHETLAQAMNKIGGHSNSGEGGEDPSRYGTDKTSKIKQVASGRFGVTPHYLVNAEILQIKIAQGAKPGEGGQLPGDKVNKMIARLRYAMAGISLISPPPHHDIYSIEDLAQLIYDLKQVNPHALVSVKLVAEAGVGTIAAGVTKAYADLITIAGYDGGTGASPLTSVKYAGSPWELGLVETHQTLRMNDLRHKVRIQVDGGLKTGLDVIKAAILGAESFGFGTAPMIAMGCKYLRICHLNNCATGVATQNNILYMKHFKPDAVQKVINYFHFVGREVREILAMLGVRSINEIIGRTDLLEIIEGRNERQNKLDLSPIIVTDVNTNKPNYCTEDKNMPHDKGLLAEQMVEDILPNIKNKTGGEFHYKVNNFNRSIGARLSGEIARRYGNHGMANKPITIYLRGTSGQSFGVWNAAGLNMYLEGDANDYVGKGMADGRIVIYPPKQSNFNSHEMVIVGNTCLYGATGGSLYISGQAGERFAVRNSGATAVVEGIGDHGCEYMTGGIVVVLGATGLNFGAGMTGGFAFILDQDHTFMDKYNHELIDTYRISTEYMEMYRKYLYRLINDHAQYTNSQWAKHILENYDSFIRRFWLVKPKAAEIGSLLDNLHSAA